MKGLKMFLLIVLFLGIFLQYSYSARATNLGQDCCNNYIKGAIPISKLMTWQKTPISCRKDAIVFVTVLNKSICANPEEKWVKRAINFLIKKNDSNTKIKSSSQSTLNSQISFSNTTQLPSRMQLNGSQEANSTQHLNSTSPLNSSAHLKN